MDLLTLLILILVVSWLLGIGFSVGGSLIHLLLVIALLVILYRLFTGQRL